MRLLKKCIAVSKDKIICTKLWLKKMSFDRKYWSKRYATCELAYEKELEEHASIMRQCKLGAVEIGVLNGESTKVLAESNRLVQRLKSFAR